MKLAVIVCGDRNYENHVAVYDALEALQPDVVIEGEQTGADTFAREAAELFGIKVEPFPADWRRYGHSAGPKRNRQMQRRLVSLRDNSNFKVMVLAFHDRIEDSKGTAGMLQLALDAKLPARLYEVRP